MTPSTPMLSPRRLRSSLYRARITAALLLLMDSLTEHRARAELPAGSRRRIGASRIEAHRAGAVALQAVEHADPDAVVGGPVRGGAAGYPHARLQVVGELPVAGAFVADRLHGPAFRSTSSSPRWSSGSQLNWQTSVWPL